MAKACGGDPPTTVRELTSDPGWDAAGPLLGWLWTDADPAFIRSWREEDGDQLFGLSVTDDADLPEGASMERWGGRAGA